MAQPLRFPAHRPILGGREPVSPRSGRPARDLLPRQLPSVVPTCAPESEPSGAHRRANPRSTHGAHFGPSAVADPCGENTAAHPAALWIGGFAGAVPTHNGGSDARSQPARSGERREMDSPLASGGPTCLYMACDRPQVEVQVKLVGKKHVGIVDPGRRRVLQEAPKRCYLKPNWAEFGSCLVDSKPSLSDLFVLFSPLATIARRSIDAAESGTPAKGARWETLNRPTKRALPPRATVALRRLCSCAAAQP